MVDSFAVPLGKKIYNSMPVMNDGVIHVAPVIGLKAPFGEGDAKEDDGEDDDGDE